MLPLTERLTVTGTPPWERALALLEKLVEKLVEKHNPDRMTRMLECQRSKQEAIPMTLDLLSDLNWPAVIVAAVAFFALGALWYAEPVFGKTWQRASNIQMPEGESFGPSFYIGPFITCLLGTLAVAMISAATGSDTLGEALVVGLVAGLGIAGSALFVTGYFDPQKPEPMLWVAIVTGYHLVGLTIAAVILALWR